jgi:hypothetical protein
MLYSLTTSHWYLGFIFFELYFIFEVAYINNTKDFIVVIPYKHTVCLEQVHPLHYISITLSPFSNSVWWVSLCSLHMYIWNMLQSSSPSLSKPSFPPPSSTDTYSIVLHLQSCPIIIIVLINIILNVILNKKACNIWFFELG